MKKIILCTLVALIAGAAAMLPSGHGVRAFLYVPANLGIPLLVAVLVYHWLLRRRHIALPWAVPVFVVVYGAIIAAMFAVDVFFVNPHLTAKVIFLTDYRGWVLPSAVMVIAVPISYRLLPD